MFERRRRVSILLLCALVAMPFSVPAWAHVFAVRGDAKIGAFAVRADGSLRGAIRAFGEPSSRRNTFGSSTCTVAWRQHGLTIEFYNLGGGDACMPEYGRFSRAFLRGNHWTTSLGLRVGATVTRLRQIYPRARFRSGEAGFWPAGYWLVQRHSILGDGGAYPGLLAEVRKGRVASFQVRFPAGGD